jgi:hypothetical protein
MWWAPPVPAAGAARPACSSTESNPDQTFHSNGRTGSIPARPLVFRSCLKRWRQPSWLPVRAASCRQFSHQPAAGSRANRQAGKPAATVSETLLAGTMQLKSEAALRVAATPPSPRVPATPRRQSRPTNQTVCEVYHATRASRPPSATGRRSYALRQLHRSGSAGQASVWGARPPRAQWVAPSRPTLDT